MRATERDKTLAEQILASYMGESDVTDGVLPESITATDDIGECQPYQALIDHITGYGPRVAEKLPFAKYERIDTSKLDHTFRITTVHKDVTNVVPEIKKYRKFYEISHVISDEYYLMNNAAQHHSAEDPTDMKPSEFLDYMHTRFRETADELRERNVQGAANFNDFLTRLQEFKRRAEVLERDDKIRIVAARRGRAEGRAERYRQGDGLFHYLIERNGTIYEIIDPDKYVLHASQSTRDRRSIGIEMENPNNASPFTPAQYDSLEWLVFRYLGNRYPTITSIISHNKAKRRANGNTKGKYCPGKGFDWSRLETIMSSNGVSYTRISHPSDKHSTADEHYTVRMSATSRPDPSRIRKDTVIRERFMSGFDRTASVNEVVIHGTGGTGTLGWMRNTREGAEDHSRYTLQGYNTQGRALVTEFEQQLQGLRSLLETTHTNILARVTTAMYTTYVNDISGKAEQININWQPGTTVAVPMEGENAPVIQALGGRLVQVSLTLKEQTPVDIAKLALMFKVPNNHETIGGMLTLARSAFDANINIRHQFLDRWFRAEQIDRFIQGMVGSPMKIQLDEPVLIENDYLNSLGLKTFQPVGMEVKTVNRAAEAYDVMITMNYMNLSNRNMESLRRSKHGSNVSLLPVTIRVAQDESRETGLGLDAHYKLYNILSRVAIKEAMTELLPLFCMHKIYQAYKAVNMLARDSEDTIPTIDLQKPNVFMATMIPANMYRQVQRTLTTSRAEGMESGQLVHQLSGAGQGILAHTLGMVISTKLLNVARGRTFGKWGAIVTAGLLIGSTTLRCIFGSAGVPETDTSSKTMYVNIPSIMPTMMWSLIQEFIEKMSVGKEEEFIGEIAGSVIDMLSDSRMANNRDRVLRFSKEINIKNGMGLDSHNINELHISIYLSGSHVDTEFRGAWFDHNISNGLGNLARRNAAGTAMRQTLIDRIGSSSSSTRERFGAMIALGALEINWITIESVVSAATLTDPMSSGERNGSLSAFFVTASELYRSGSSRKHCVEVLTAICTMSMMDMLTNGLINQEGRASMYGHTDSFAHNLQRSTAGMSNEEIGNIVANAVNAEMKTSMAQAKRVIQNRGLNYQTLSGVFADNSFLGISELRKGYCNAMGIIVNYMYLCSAGIDDNLPSHGQLAENYTLPRIMNIIDRARWEIVLEELNTLKEYLNAVAADMLPSLITAIGAAFLSGGWSVVLKIIHWGVLIYENWNALSMLFSEAVTIVLGKGSMFALSKWCAGRISESMDRTQLLEACYISQIWMPSALEFGQDALDDRWTSYMDFPAIISEGTPLPPDFYVYKAGFTKRAFEQMTSFMSDITEIVRARYSDLDGEDITNMRQQLQQDLGQAAANGIARVQQGLLQAVMSNRPAETRHWNAYYRALAKCGDYINMAFYDDDDTEFGVASTKYGSLSSSLPASKCMMRITFTDTSVTVVPGTLFRRLLSHEDTIEALQDRGTIITRIVEASNLCEESTVRLNIRSFMQSAIPMILEYIDTNRALTGEFVEGLRTMPGTLGNLLLLKSIVGSNMRAVGKPGLALFTSQINKIGHNALRRASTLQTQYIFPTVKLYFIEEDDENFYLFDDLYSYASIVGISINMDKYSPIQTAEIKITNLFGRLNDILADQRNKEMNFVRGPDENSALNSIMLRPGCKVKIQVGNTPILTEEDTVFTGRISSLNFGPLTTISATSAGDMFLEYLSKDSVKVYGSLGAATGSIPGRMISDTVRDSIRVLGADNYLTPVSKIKHVVGYVLNDVLQATERLTDFSIRPPVEVQDPELESSSTKLMDTIKRSFFASQSSEFIEMVGGARIDVNTNQQLFENVHIRNDLVDTSWVGVGTLVTEGFWISRNETAWDIMNEINLLLPNHNLMVRPFDTRSTLVWTDREGYYRYRRTVDLDNIMTHAAASKVLPIIRDPSFKAIQLLQAASKSLKSTNPRIRAGGISLITQLAYTSQRVYGSFMMDAPSSYRRQIPDNLLIKFGTDEPGYGDIIDKSLQWIPLKMLETSNLRSLNKAMIGVYDEIADENDTDEFRRNGVAELKIDDLGDSDDVDNADSFYPDFVRGGSDKSTVVYLLALNFAAEDLVNFMGDMVLSRSKSHRRASDFHMKMSGRDIVKNDIQLQEPYNTVKMIFPKEEVDDPERLAMTAIMGADDSSASEITVPIHYKLKPWGQRVYQSFFKNANAFPTARTQAIATASSSVLSNLMAQTYGGTITMLGDSRIREGDRIFIWDENKDMFGVVGVRSHTLIIDPQDGCLSVIEPEMVTRNDGKFQSTSWEGLTSFVGAVGDTLIAGAIAVGVVVGAWVLRKRILMRAKGELLSLSMTSRFTRGIAQSLSNLRRNAPILRSLGRGTFTWFNTLNEGNLAKNVAKAYAKIGTTMANIFTESNFVNTTITGFRQAANRLGTSSTLGAKGLGIRRLLSNISDMRYNSFMSKAFDDTMDAMVTARRIGSGAGEFDFAVRYTDAVVDQIRSYITRSGGYSLNERELAAVTTRLREAVWPALQQRLNQSSLNPFSLDGSMSLNDRVRTLLREADTARNAALSHIRGLDPSALPGNLRTNLRTIGRSDDAALRRYLTDSAEKIMQGYQKECYRRSFGFLRFIQRNAGRLLATGIALGTVVEAWGLAKRFAEMTLLTRYTADKITIAPLMFRGEPFMAGLEGVEKKDGEDAGFIDIMKARFQSTFDGAIHNVQDPFQQALFELTRELRRADNARRR